MDGSDKKKPPRSVEEVQKELQDFIRNKFGADVLAFPIDASAVRDSVDERRQARESDDAEPVVPPEVLGFDRTPREVKAWLDRFVVGQDAAKRTLAVAICDHYNHVRRSLGEPSAPALPAAKGTVAKGTVTKGTVTKGTVTKGTVAKGTVAKGTVARNSGSQRIAPEVGSANAGPEQQEFSPQQIAANVEYVKQNVILLGPTGVGKTYLVRILAQLIGVPFVKADSTKFSETGYVGGDVEDLVRELVRVADGNLRLASHGIIFLDEIDKVASVRTAHGRDPSGRGVQVGLLKLMEETEVSVRSPMDLGAQFQDLMQMRGGAPAKRTINTKHILFVVSGAFSGIEDIIEKRLSERNVGLAAGTRAGDVHDRKKSANLIPRVTTQDFVEYGFEPEFIGRLPVRVALDPLDADDLFRILATSEGSILRQYRQSFADYGIDIAFEPDALRHLARLAADEKTGARGLMSVLERSLRDFKFDLPGGTLRRFAVTESLVDDPSAALAAIQSAPADAETAYWMALVREFETEFSYGHGVRLVLDQAAVGTAIRLSEEIGVPVKEYLTTTFESHVAFLRKVLQESGRSQLTVTPQVLAQPGAGIDIWLAETPER